MLMGLIKRKPLIIPGARAKLAYLLGRLFPAITQRVSERMVIDTLKACSAKASTHTHNTTKT